MRRKSLRGALLLYILPFSTCTTLVHLNKLLYANVSIDLLLLFTVCIEHVLLQVVHWRKALIMLYSNGGVRA
jgi:hypothetical protein